MDLHKETFRISDNGMRVMRFDLRSGASYATIDTARYAVFRLGDGELAVCNDACPHRGGPLHLAEYDARTRTLRCPWHGRRVAESVLARQRVPTVQVSQSLWALVPHSAEAACLVRRKRIVPNER